MIDVRHLTFKKQLKNTTQDARTTTIVSSVIFRTNIFEYSKTYRTFRFVDDMTQLTMTTTL